MKIYSKLSGAYRKLPNPVVALGMFDGMHIGHQSIVRRAVELARAEDGTAMVFTFQNHPMSVLSPERMPLSIGSRELRQRILEGLGVEVLLEIPFTKALARRSPEEFLTLLQRGIAPHILVTGPNYTFGRMGKGTGRMLLRDGERYGFRAEICPAVMRDGRPVSSTRIRALISEGDLEQANEFLGRPFTYCARVVHGERRGRLLGFPTANLPIPVESAMVPNGAYAVRVIVCGAEYNGLANVGNNPTFGEGSPRKLEVNIRDFSDNIYDEMISVQFLERLRGEQRFSSADLLVRQLRRDLDKAKHIWEGVR